MPFKITTIEEALDYAIQREQESADMYLDLANRVADKSLKTVLIEYAKEEMGHKKKLQFEKILLGKSVYENQTILDFDVELLDTPTLDKQLKFSLEDLIFLAVKKENMAFKVYAELAGMIKEKKLQKVLLELAEEEVRHKIRFEIEYNNIKNQKH